MTPRFRSLVAALALAMAVPTFSAAAPRYAHSRSFVTVPAGTTLHVRLAQPIHVNFTRRGATYNGVLDRSVGMRRAIMIPRGATVRLRAVDVNRSGRSDRVLLTATAVSFGGRTYRISTSDVQARGRREGRGMTRRTVGGAALGTATGAAFGGGAGAAAGAAVGGTSGIVSSSRAGERVRISANTRFQFRLNNALTLHH